MSVLTMPAPGIPPFPVQRISVDKYHELIERDMYTEDDKVELIEGYIVPKMARGLPHDSTMDCFDLAFEGRLPPGWKMRCQRAVTLIDSEPEPDYAIVRMPARGFESRHPTPKDIGQLTEVSDSSLDQDRGEKKRVYARAGIPVCWIVNLVDNIIEVYTQPSGPTENPDYASRQDFARGDVVPVVLDGVTIASLPVSDLLPS